MMLTSVPLFNKICRAPLKCRALRWEMGLQQQTDQAGPCPPRGCILIAKMDNHQVTHKHRH